MGFQQKNEMPALMFSLVVAVVFSNPSVGRETVEPRGVVADDFAPDGLRQFTEFAFDVFLRIGPDAVGMREIRTPHDVVRADFIDQPNADAVALIRRITLAM